MKKQPKVYFPFTTRPKRQSSIILNYCYRYAPRFLHNLHHLVSDLASVEQKLGSIRLKSSSLGRSAAGLASSGTRSWSSKDLLSLGQSDSSAGKSKIQVIYIISYFNGYSLYLALSLLHSIKLSRLSLPVCT